MLVRALAIVGVALLIGLADSYKRPIAVSITGSASDPTRTEALRETEEEIKSAQGDPSDPNAGMPTISGFVVTVEQAKRMHDLGAQFFDAREKIEFDAGHIKDAIMADPLDDQLMKKEMPDYLKRYADEKGKAKAIVVYCNGGGCESSEMVALKFRDYGFANTYVFEEGYPVWKAKGYPTARN